MKVKLSNSRVPVASNYTRYLLPCLLPLLLLVTVSAGVNAQAQSEPRYPLPRRVLPLEKALIKLNEAGAELIYRSDILPQLAVRVPGGRKTLPRWLDVLLADTELTYERGAAGYLILRDTSLLNRNFTAFGMVTDARSGERLIGAAVQSPSRGSGVITNEYGFYTLSAGGGEQRLRATYVGYEPIDLPIVLRSDTMIDLRLQPNNRLPQIVVTALESDHHAASYTETGIRIGRQEVAQLGGPGGQADPLQLARLLPGVASGADGVGGLFIRGSESGHNLVLLDGVPVFNVNHAAGLFSIFSNHAIRRIDLYKDGLPTRFGGRIGGVVDVHTRDGNLYNHELTVGSSLLATQVAAEGPISGGNSSFLLTGRYFWAGDILRKYSQEYKAAAGRTGSTDYDVYDFNFKLNQRAGERGRLYLSLYSGVDDYANRGWQADTLIQPSGAGTEFINVFPTLRTSHARWGNTVGALRYNHVFGDRCFGNFRLHYSDLRTEASFERSDSTKELTSLSADGTAFSGRYASDIRQWGLAFDGQYATTGNGSFRFGGEINTFDFTPLLRTAPVSLSRFSDIPELGSISEHRPQQYTAYGSYTGQYRNLHFRFGLRGSLWHNEGNNFLNFSPRLLLAGPLSATADWRLTYDRSVQPVHLLSSRAIALPFDLWVPTTGDIEPARADQVSGRVALRPLPNLNFEASAYYKKMDRLLTYREGSQQRGKWLDYVTQGNGKSYGMELSINRPRGRLRGWLSYTFAKSNRQFDEVNLGREFAFRYDRRHSVNLVGIYQLGERTTLTGSWRYGSGAAFSFSLERITVFDENGNPQIIDVVGERNGLRLPPNHRFDLNLHTVLSAAGSRFTHALDVGLYNVYDRHNPIYYEKSPTYSVDGTELQFGQEVTQTYLAPLLPVLSYQLTFGSRPDKRFGK